MDLGICKLSGSDISQKAVEDTKTNLDWYVKQSKQYSSEYQVVQADAAKLSESFAPDSIQAVVSEPYMGRPLKGRESLASLQKQALELQELYGTVLVEIKKILNPGGTVVMIFPSFRWNNTWITTVPTTLGTLFSVVLHEGNTFLRYHRPDQHLARDIWTLTKS